MSNLMPFKKCVLQYRLIYFANFNFLNSVDDSDFKIYFFDFDFNNRSILINDVVKQLNFEFSVFSKLSMFNNNVENSSSKINEFNDRFSIQMKNQNLLSCFEFF